jgi:hypothetical protein
MTRPHVGLLALFTVIIIAACAGSAPAPTDGPPRNPAELRQALIEAFGPLWFCDPDFYPIQRVDEIDAARERWPEVRADAETFAVITAALGIPSDAAFTDDQKLAVYRAWKVHIAIALEPAGGGGFGFRYLAQPKTGAAAGQLITGTISRSGAIAIERQEPAGEPMCPICLSLGTVIDTPVRATPVEDLRIGDPVWTLDAAGRRVAATVIGIGQTPAPAGHVVVRLELADGRTLTASPGHPLADRRLVGDLRRGDIVDGSVVRMADRQPYTSAETFDILVSGPTGTYLSSGIALGSTID